MPRTNSQTRSVGSDSASEVEINLEVNPQSSLPMMAGRASADSTRKRLLNEDEPKSNFESEAKKKRGGLCTELSPETISEYIAKGDIIYIFKAFEFSHFYNHSPEKRLNVVRNALGYLPAFSEHAIKQNAQEYLDNVTRLLDQKEKKDLTHLLCFEYFKVIMAHIPNLIVKGARDFRKEKGPSSYVYELQAYNISLYVQLIRNRIASRQKLVPASKKQFFDDIRSIISTLSSPKSFKLFLSFCQSFINSAKVCADTSRSIACPNMGENFLGCCVNYLQALNLDAIEDKGKLIQDLLNLLSKNTEAQAVPIIKKEKEKEEEEEEEDDDADQQSFEFTPFEKRIPYRQTLAPNTTFNAPTCVRPYQPGAPAAAAVAAISMNCASTTNNYPMDSLSRYPRPHQPPVAMTPSTYVPIANNYPIGPLGGYSESQQLPFAATPMTYASTTNNYSMGSVGGYSGSQQLPVATTPMNHASTINNYPMGSVGSYSGSRQLPVASALTDSQKLELGILSTPSGRQCYQQQPQPLSQQQLLSQILDQQPLSQQQLLSQILGQQPLSQQPLSRNEQQLLNQRALTARHYLSTSYSSTPPTHLQPQATPSIKANTVASDVKPVNSLNLQEDQKNSLRNACSQPIESAKESSSARTVEANTVLPTTPSRSQEDYVLIELLHRDQVILDGIVKQFPGLFDRVLASLKQAEKQLDEFQNDENVKSIRECLRRPIEEMTLLKGQIQGVDIGRLRPGATSQVSSSVVTTTSGLFANRNRENSASTPDKEQGLAASKQ